MIWLLAVACACIVLSALHYNRLGWELWRPGRARRFLSCGTSLNHHVGVRTRFERSCQLLEFYPVHRPVPFRIIAAVHGDEPLGRPTWEAFEDNVRGRDVSQELV